MKMKSSKTSGALKAPKGKPAPSKGAIGRSGGASPKMPSTKIGKLGKG